MKVIDLLNLMVIGKEDLPKRIRYEDEIYYLTDDNETYIGTISHSAIGRRHCLEQCLTDEVEILEEEKKIPEKSNIDFNTKLPASGCSENEAFMMTCISHLGKTIDSLIDYLKSKGE